MGQLSVVGGQLSVGICSCAALSFLTAANRPLTTSLLPSPVIHRKFVSRIRGEQLVDLAVDVAPDLIEIGRAAAAALAPLGIVQRHDALQVTGIGSTGLVRRRQLVAGTTFKRARPAVRQVRCARESARPGRSATRYNRRRSGRSNEPRRLYQTRRVLPPVRASWHRSC